MINTITFKETAWLDIEHPTKEDVEQIIDMYHIDRATAHELVSPSPAPHAEFYKDYIYVVLHFPSSHAAKRDAEPHEVDFILTENALITARFDHIDALHTVARKIEAESITEKNDIAHPSSYLFFRMLRELYQSLFLELTAIDQRVNMIEKKIFTGHERDMVIAISRVSRSLINLERALSQHRDVLDSLKQRGTALCGDYFALHTQSVIDSYSKLHHLVRSRRDVVTDLRDTNDSLLSAKQNEASRILAVLALIAVPMSLIVSIFQIDTKARPLVGLEYDFWILTGVVIATGAVLFAFFKHKKWL